jgi:hypothetical protein
MPTGNSMVMLKVVVQRLRFCSECRRGISKSECARARSCCAREFHLGVGVTCKKSLDFYQAIVFSLQVGPSKNFDESTDIPVLGEELL